MAKNYSFTAPTDREIVVSWVVDAPRELVFKAYTDPNLIPKWWGPRVLTTTVDKMELRPGGAWRFVQTMPGHPGQHAFHGVVREVVPPERLVQTTEFEGMPGHVSVDTVTFEEQDGKTKITTKTVVENVEDRNRMIETGMEAGMAESIDRFAELIREIQKARS